MSYNYANAIGWRGPRCWTCGMPVRTGMFMCSHCHAEAEEAEAIEDGDRSRPGDGSTPMKPESTSEKSMVGRVNAYDCKNGHTTWTIHKDHGVTPFLIRCRAGCSEMAQSRFYRVPDRHPTPTHEWYRWTKAQARRKERRFPGSLRHWRQGGLDLRPVQEPTDD